MQPIDDRDLPSDADELRAIDRARRRICRHRSDDSDCECHEDDSGATSCEGCIGASFENRFQCAGCRDYSKYEPNDNQEAVHDGKEE